MTTALALEVGDSAVAEPAPAGVVSVHSMGFAHSAAACSCGWVARRRYLRAAAEQDAWAHAVQDRCAVSSPLVVAW